MRTFIFLKVLCLFFSNLCWATSNDETKYLKGNSIYQVEDDVELLRNEKFICISLGSMCFPAKHLTHHDLHLRSYPFDWNITPFEALYNIIDNDFESFFDLSYMRTTSNWEEAVNTKYNFSFCHTVITTNCYDTPNGLQGINEEGVLHLEKIAEQFDRRIKRFHAVLNLGIPVFFFRHYRTTPHQAIILKYLLQEKFPTCNFTLVILDDNDDGEDWKNAKTEGIKHYILNPKFDLSTIKPNQPRHPAYTKIFQDLGLL